MAKAKKEYLEHREKSGNRSTAAGAILAVGVHVAAVLCISFNGLSYIYPPPEESSFVLDFTEEVQIVQPKYSKEPVAEKVDKEKPVELVKRSESPIAENIPNETPAQTPDNFGDVETPTPPVDTTKPKVDPRAAFPGMSRKNSDATTPHVAEEASDRFVEGQADGNSSNAAPDGKSNAHLQGRRVDGNLAEPAYKKQEAGVVVVTIWVDIYGEVKKAVVNAEGTTIDDTNLWNEARNAAMRTHFSKVEKITAETPQLQEGTITYKFRLK